MTVRITITRRHDRVRRAGSWADVPPVEHCPGCSAPWWPAGALPLPMPCGCSDRPHASWRCGSCPVVVAESCADPELWDAVHVPYDAVRITAHRSGP